MGFERMDAPETSTQKRSLPTIIDVAAQAGVSPATVDRVLNRRSSVRPATAQRVIAAAEALGYLGADADFAASTQKPLRILFLLPAGQNRFLTLLARTILAAKSHFEALALRPTLETIDSFRPDLLAQRLRQATREVDGVVFMALEHPLVRDAVDHLAHHGIPVVTIISDIVGSGRAAYVGLDNRSVGRTVGYVMGRFIGQRPAKVAMIAGSLSYRAHEEREMGFMHLFQEMFPQTEVLGVREGYDNPERNYCQTRMVLARHGDLAGIYNIGGAPEGVGKALKEARKEHEIVLIGHGLTPEARALLLDGTMDAVITQNPDLTLMQCTSVFLNIRAGRAAQEGLTPMRSEIIFRENLP